MSVGSLMHKFGPEKDKLRLPTEVITGGNLNSIATPSKLTDNI